MSIFRSDRAGVFMNNQSTIFLCFREGVCVVQGHLLCHTCFGQYVIVIPWLQGFIVENHPEPEGAARGRGRSFRTINP